MTPHEVIKNSLEKKCSICGIGKPKIKYCSTKCAYEAINNKLKLRKSMQNNNNKTLTPNPNFIPQRYNLPYQIAQELFKVCPFCGCDVNVFTVPETRYGQNNNYSWNIECKNMGCIFEQPENGWQKFTDLMNTWNKRYE